MQAEAFKNAFLLHFLERIPKKVLIETAIKASIDVELDLMRKSKKDLVKSWFEILKHPHIGDEYSIAKRIKMGRITIL